MRKSGFMVRQKSVPATSQDSHKNGMCIGGVCASTDEQVKHCHSCITITWRMDKKPPIDPMIDQDFCADGHKGLDDRLLRSAFHD